MNLQYYKDALARGTCSEELRDEILNLSSLISYKYSFDQNLRSAVHISTSSLSYPYPTK
jgi:hypothetical protein